MSAPPAFGPTTARWGLGSAVLARAWQRDENGDAVERVEAGQVVGLRAGGPEGWIASVSFGVLLDLANGGPRDFNPSQLERHE